MDKKELKDMTDAELLAELESLNEEVDDMFVEDEEDKWLSSFLIYILIERKSRHIKSTSIK